MGIIFSVPAHHRLSGHVLQMSVWLTEGEWPLKNLADCDIDVDRRKKNLF